MDCPPWLWKILLERYWPEEFLDSRVSEGLTWFEKQKPDLSPSDASPIFIFAAGWRSGSTLLQRLLNSHPRVMIWGESYEYSFLLYHLSAPLGGLSKKPLDLDFLSPHMPRMPNELASLLTTQWIANLTPPIADLKQAHLAYLNTLFGTRAIEGQRPRWGLKMVRATATIAHYLRWLYPKAKILYLFRNPYASFRSYLNASKLGWYLYYPRYRVNGVVPFIVHWRHCMNTFLATYQPLDAFLVRFESLTDRQLLGPLQEYLNLELDPATLDLKVDMKHETTRNLTSSHRLMIRFIAGDMAKRYGYTAEDV